MYTLHFEGLSLSEQAAIKNCAPDLLNQAARLGLTIGDSLIQRWFGSQCCPGHSNYEKFHARRTKFEDYLLRQCVLLTFVKKIINQTVDNVLVERGDLAQVQSHKCFPVTSTGISEFVTSGLRIYILTNGFSNQSPEEQLNTLAHEITHRVLNTSDYGMYGKQTCLDNASRNWEKSYDHAEAWGYFYQEVIYPTR